MNKARQPILYILCIALATAAAAGWVFYAMEHKAAREAMGKIAAAQREKYDGTLAHQAALDDLTARIDALTRQNREQAAALEEALANGGAYQELIEYAGSYVLHGLSIQGINAGIPMDSVSAEKSEQIIISFYIYDTAAQAPYMQLAEIALYSPGWRLEKLDESARSNTSCAMMPKDDGQYYVLIRNTNMTALEQGRYTVQFIVGGAVVRSETFTVKK